MTACHHWFRLYHVLVQQQKDAKTNDEKIAKGHIKVVTKDNMLVQEELTE